MVSQTERPQTADARSGHRSRAMRMPMVVMMRMMIRRLRKVVMVMGALQITRHLRAEVVMEGGGASRASSTSCGVRQQRHLVHSGIVFSKMAEGCH